MRSTNRKFKGYQMTTSNKRSSRGSQKSRFIVGLAIGSLAGFALLLAIRKRFGGAKFEESVAPEAGEVVCEGVISKAADVVSAPPLHEIGEAGSEGFLPGMGEVLGECASPEIEESIPSLKMGESFADEITSVQPRPEENAISEADLVLQEMVCAVVPQEEYEGQSEPTEALPVVNVERVSPEILPVVEVEGLPLASTHHVADRWLSAENVSAIEPETDPLENSGLARTAPLVMLEGAADERATPSFSTEAELSKPELRMSEEAAPAAEIAGSWLDDTPTEKLSAESQRKPAELTTTGLKEQDIWSALLEGGRLSGAKKYREAERLYQKMIRLYPEEPRLHNAMGALYAEQERYRDAEKSWLKSLDLAPSTETYNFLGSVWESQKRYDEAVGAYQKALEINPQDVMARSNLAWLFASQKRYANALKEFQKTQTDQSDLDPGPVRVGKRRA